MKKLLLAFAAASALGVSGVAVAQPAYSDADGPPPAQYPPCTHAHQDRCVANAAAAAHHHHHHRPRG